MEPDKKLRILLVHNFYQMPGGEDTVVRNEKQLLEEYGHTVFLYSRDNSEIKNFNIWQKLCLPFTAVFSLKTFREVIRYIQREQIDLLHVHNTLSLISPSVYYAAFCQGVPVVQTLHNFRLVCPGAIFYRQGTICEDCGVYGLHCAIKYKCYRNSRIQSFVCVFILTIYYILGAYKRLYYICLTDFNKAKLLEYGQKKILFKDRIFIKPNFTNTEVKIKPFNKRKKQFVFVGRPEAVKGIKVLLEAWKDIKEYDLLICGISSEIKWCQQYIRMHDMKNVYMLGKVSNEKVIEIVSESLALILPTQLYEGFPMTIVESLSCGTPVIGSNMGNVGDLIIEGECGLKFDPGSSSELEKKVYELFDMTQSSRRIYETHYNKETNYKILIRIYKTILNQKGHGNRDMQDK